LKVAESSLQDSILCTKIFKINISTENNKDKEIPKVVSKLLSEASIALCPQSKAVLEKLIVLQLATKNLPSNDDDNNYGVYTISHNRTLEGVTLIPFKILFYLSVHNVLISPTMSFGFGFPEKLSTEFSSAEWVPNGIINS
jgi:hypothetical protein